MFDKASQIFIYICEFFFNNLGYIIDQGHLIKMEHN